jgi:hypothetical protein
MAKFGMVSPYMGTDFMGILGGLPRGAHSFWPGRFLPKSAKVHGDHPGVARFAA